MTSKRGVMSWQRNLYTLVIAQFLSTAAFSGVTPLLPLFIQDLGIKNPSEAAFWAGVATFASGFGSFLAAPIWGTLADRYGRKSMVLRSTAGGACILVLSGLSPSLGVLIAMRAIHGVLAGVSTATSALVASQAPRSRIPFAVGLIQMAFFLGSMTGPLAGGIIADALGYRAPFFVMGVSLVVACLIVVLFVREDFKLAETSGSHQSPIDNVRMVLGITNVIPFLGMLMIIRFGPFMLQPVLAVFMQGLVTEGAATAAGLALSLLGLASAFSSVVIGRWGHAERFLLVVAIAGCVASVLFLPQLWVQSAIQSALLIGLVGLCQGSLLTSINSLLSASVSRERQGAVFGVAQSAGALSQGVAALAAGTLTIAFGVRSIFAVDAGMYFLLGLGAWWMYRRTTKNRVGTQASA
ncbi:MAG: MFS transporter [Dehalococcoidia bacterium]|nr:MFS transporter [Dehalococcoidia bacterium]